MDLRANTAVDVLIGPFVDNTDGDTAEIALTIVRADVQLSKNGQTLTQKTETSNAVHDADGYYNCPLDVTDLNTEGNLVLKVRKTGALTVRHEHNVLSEAAWDSIYAPKDAGFMDINVKTVGRADAQETEANNLEAACSNYSVTRGLTGTAVPAVAADGIGGLPISDAGGLDLDTLLGYLTGNVALAATALSNIQWTNVRAGYLDELSAVNLPADIDALLARLTLTRAGYLDNLSAGAVALASVCTEIRLAELAAGNLPADIDLLLTRLTLARAGYLDELNAPNLPADIDALNAKIIGTIQTGTHVAQSGNSYPNVNANLDAAVSTRSSHSATAVWAVSTRTLTSFGTLVADVTAAVFSFVVENSKTFSEFMRVIFAFAKGKSDGGGTATLTFQDDADTKARITATVDIDGNRTNVVVDGS